MQGPYADHILDARDVCSNCLRKNRVDRVDPIMDTGPLGHHELDSHYSRDRRRTTVEYAPADTASGSKGVFCECGVEGSHERIWDPDDVDEARFRDLLVGAVATLERKDVDIKRRMVLSHALGQFRDGAAVDEALANAVEAGIGARVAAD